MWRRHRKGLSAFRPDHDHVHFVLQRSGFGVNATVLIVSGLCAMGAAIGIISTLDGIPEPLLFVGLLTYFWAHNLFLSHAWKITKRFRHLLTVPENERE
jgi:UDP-GlcNAc:undecaprenyl-phosphate GlcNAc-1-phosphate transferase